VKHETAAKLAPAAAAAPDADHPLGRPWEWSIVEAWSWVARTWHDLSQMPYLGLLSVLLAALLVFAILTKLLSRR
jgi:hypothetical protein